MERKTIFDEYVSYQEEYTKIYGKETIVLMEVGSFFELYGIETREETIGKVTEIGQLLNIHITRKNKKIKRK